MAAGWSVLGNCYTTSEQVINAFTGLQAFWASSSNWWFQPVNISFNQSTSTVSFDLRNDQGGLLTGKTFKLQSCDTDYTPTPTNAVIIQNENGEIIGGGNGENMPIDYAQAAAFWSFGLITVLTLWLIAKKAGVIIEAIRRF